MLKFEDTRLLRHPTVEKAYNVMRTFFQDGDDFALKAVGTGEIISAYAKNPDPDAIAASILMDGMIVSYEASQFASSVSPKAAEYLEKFYELDLENPVYNSVGEQQVLLAHSIQGLEQVRGMIESDNPDYRRIVQVLDVNEKSLLKIVHATTEMEMAQIALEKFVKAKQALNDLVKVKQAELDFDKTGLPNHPDVKAVYEHMKAWDISGHPLGAYTQTNTGIAKVLVETGATQDPDVIGAALLNQYHASSGGALEGKFSARLVELVKATSPWSRDDDSAKQTGPDIEMIRSAALTYFLERQTEGLRQYADTEDFETIRGVYALENLETIRDRMEARIATETTAPLKARMTAAVKACDDLMNEPENKAIRKPGTPHLDRDW